MSQSSRTAIVTGGANGLGLGITRHLVASSYRVLVLDVDEAAGSAIADPPGGLAFRRCDIGSEDDVAAAARHAAKSFDGVDVLVNNAGIANPDSGPVEELPLEDWNRVLRTNLTGPFLCTKHFVPLLRKRRGAIVNIASTRALQSEPNSEAYTASKGGLLALTHALAVSLGPEIRVNAVSPGWIDVRRGEAASEPLEEIDHRQHPVGRVGDPTDVAALVGYLISDEARFVTAQNFVCDGGMTRRMIYAD